MKTYISRLFIFLGLSLISFSCDDRWEEHYGQAAVVSAIDVELYAGDVESYMRSQSNLSLLTQTFESTGKYDSLSSEHMYTVVVYPNSVMEGSEYLNDSRYANYCISDVAVSPAALKEGMGIRMRYGKNVWIYQKNDALCIDAYPIRKSVQTRNAYVYYLEAGPIPIRKSVYEVLNELGPEYAQFRSLVARFEEVYFDKENSTPSGYNSSGNLVYSDSVWAVKNKLMDRYSEAGVSFWDMRSEDYVTTLVVPDNDVLTRAIDTAMAKVPLFLGRPATQADRLKYEKWVVQACFFNQRLEEEAFMGDQDLDGVGAYLRDSLNEKKHTSIQPAMWRPTVQRIRTGSQIPCSNGNVFTVDHLKIPNNVIIYRLKSKFYQLWAGMTPQQKSDHFRWTNWMEPLIVNDAQGSFELSETLPVMYYHVLTAIPTKEARKDSLLCSVTYDGLLYNESTNQIRMAHIPAGEYYLRMGFKHSLQYSLSIYFNDSLVVKDMVMYAQGSNFHFDRGSVGVVEYNGAMSIGYPEGYNWLDWAAKSEKAQAYDTDGYPVAVVNVPQDGPFTITIESSDNSYLYNDKSYTRDKNNITMLMMYHWCLRPTKNNY